MVGRADPRGVSTGHYVCHQISLPDSGAAGAAQDPARKRNKYHSGGKITYADLTACLLAGCFYMFCNTFKAELI